VVILGIIVVVIGSAQDRGHKQPAGRNGFGTARSGTQGPPPTCLSHAQTIALIRHPAALEEDCRIADIVIAPFSVGKGCSTARVVVDRRALQAEGAHAI